MLVLRGIHFGTALCSSGARNFFGDGWWYHSYLRPFGLNYAGSTFVAKTTTLHPRAGNMPLDGTTPKELLPACIKVRMREGVALNSVGLSGPGANAVLSEGFDEGKWATLKAPFFLSFMAMGETMEERLKETENFSALLSSFLSFYKPRVGLQVNFSCPNVGLGASKVSEMWKTIDLFKPLDIPIVAKINALFPLKDLLVLEAHPGLDAICVSNTIPWGTHPDLKKWERLFGETSPLAHLGGGGISGAPLLPIVLQWIQMARMAGWDKPIIGGGGVLSPDDAEAMLLEGADAVELGSISFLRPWRVAKTLKAINGWNRDKHMAGLRKWKAQGGR